MEVGNAEVVRIEVRGRKAMNRTPEIVVVGDNSGYKVRFDFDELWADTTVRTAIFVFNRTTVAVPFEGNECDMPPIVGATMCEVGVTAGDIITTVPAYIPCELSIKGVGGKIEPPTEDVYAKIVSMIEAGMLKGEKGDKGDKGEKGDAGSIKFIPVVKLPDKTDPTIDTSAIYVEPLEKPDEKNKYGEYIFVNGDWEKLGEITIEVDHSEYVKFTDYATSDKAGVGKVHKYYGVYLQDGFFAVNSASNWAIDNRNDKASIGNDAYFVPITRLDYSVLSALTTNSLTPTDEQLKAFYKWIGAVQYYAEARNGIARFINGQLIVNTPTESAHATNKGYVDGKIAELQAQIDALKGQS